MSHRETQRKRRRPSRRENRHAASTQKAEEITPTIRRVDLTPERPVSVFVARRSYDSEPRTGMHLHLPAEVGVVLAGGIKRNHGDGWFHVGVGQGWTCGPLEPHRWRVDQGGPLEFLFCFLPSLMSQMPDLAGLNPTAVFSSPVRSRAIGSRPAFRRALAALGRELLQKYQKGVQPGPAYVDLLRVLELIGKEVAEGIPQPRGSWSDLSVASRIQRALELVERTPQRRVSVDEAARACRMARSTFERLFRQVTGLSFGGFALHSRLVHAAHMLRHTDWTMQMIADQLGFGDVSHLNHAFVAHYGMAPSRYRAGHSGEPPAP